MARGGRLVALALVAALLTLLPAAPTSADPARTRAEMRVNQDGWLPHESKLATLMAFRPLGHTTFTVPDRHHAVVLRGTVPRTPAGVWGSRFPAVHTLDLSALHQRGRYTLRTRRAVRVPALDMTAAAVLAASAQLGLRGGR